MFFHISYNIFKLILIASNYYVYMAWLPIYREYTSIGVLWTSIYLLQKIVNICSKSQQSLPKGTRRIRKTSPLCSLYALAQVSRSVIGRHFSFAPYPLLQK